MNQGAVTVGLAYARLASLKLSVFGLNSICFRFFMFEETHLLVNLALEGARNVRGGQNCSDSKQVHILNP